MYNYIYPLPANVGVASLLQCLKVCDPSIGLTNCKTSLGGLHMEPPTPELVPPLCLDETPLEEPPVDMTLSGVRQPVIGPQPPPKLS